ncbi:hypothetical protein GUJ93_ZPchr0001g32421 [Zizania palustris]|uniref:HTH myb-type domain-containing protein n=1 Tax=Zizania palustris TaxID=103762 RepID=A0A8J5SCF4_ZIZPA|nr:hypothetical protein GUJ93_ZPchr0001g32421 [Zizania palustris]
MVNAGRGAGSRVLEWETGLPTAGEMTPISHQLVPPALAAAFRIDLPSSSVDSPTSHLSFRVDDEDDEDEEEGEGEGEGGRADNDDVTVAGGEGVGGGRGRKKARMVWTPELHHRFVEAVAHLGEKGAVPKAIVQLMNVDGLTRENVASHLQKYRLYLKRTRGTATAATPRSPAPYVPCFGAKPAPDTAANRSGHCAFVSSSPATSSDATTTKQFSS